MDLKRMLCSVAVFLAMSAVVAYAINIEKPENGKEIDNNSDIYVRGNFATEDEDVFIEIVDHDEVSEQMATTTADGHGNWDELLESPENGWSIDGHFENHQVRVEDLDSSETDFQNIKIVDTQ